MAARILNSALHGDTFNLQTLFSGASTSGIHKKEGTVCPRTRLDALQRRACSAVNRTPPTWLQNLPSYPSPTKILLPNFKTGTWVVVAETEAMCRDRAESQQGRTDTPRGKRRLINKLIFRRSSCDCCQLALKRWRCCNKTRWSAGTSLLCTCIAQ